MSRSVFTYTERIQRNGMNDSALLPNLKSLSRQVLSSIEKNKKKHSELMTTIAIFDLSQSTSMKLKFGHDNAMQAVLFHNEICRIMIKKFKGKIINELGDGVLAHFHNPMNACLAAINIREAINQKKTIQKNPKMKKIATKAAIMMGVVEKIRTNRRYDVFGSPIDRCSRLESFVLPNQILIDSTVCDSVQTFLGNYDDIKVGKRNRVTLSGYGETDVYELASYNFRLKNKLNE